VFGLRQLIIDSGAIVLQNSSTIRTASVRELRNHYTRLLSWLSSGEEILITQRGKPVARLVPETNPAPGKVDWSKSAAVTRDRTSERILSVKESADLIHESSSKW